MLERPSTSRLPIAATADQRGGGVMMVIGAALLLNVGGIALRSGGFFREMRDLTGPSVTRAPTTGWGMRMLGLGLLVFGVLIAVYGEET